MATTVEMPELGEGVIEGTISRWLKQEGDQVARYEPILEIETDKVTTEATAEVAGILLKILVPEGQTVPVGTVLAHIGQAGETVAAEEKIDTAAEPAQKREPAPAGKERVAPARGKSANGDGQEKGAYSGRISPVVGRIADEHNVDLGQVQGTGLGGRITKKDILAYVENRRPVAEPAAEPDERRAPASRPLAMPRPPAAQPTAVPGETVPLTGIRRSIAEHMVRSKHTSPHVTTVFEVDFTAVAKHRSAHKETFARDGANLTFTAYIIAATVQALKQHPMVNSSWSDDGIVLKREINVGMATAIPDGLIVPVIKQADGMSLLGLARTINDLADRARNKQLQPQEVQGGTFSVTNHGTSGSLFGTPIINQPQTGILGIGAIEKRVKIIDDAIAIRPLAYVSFTFDHRILDGSSADAFVGTVKEVLESWK
jgi:2-oxoisovalerate dehydrogenase E2 component (dihydrolipoyl transacylase)